jgi:hypothetical protein
MDLPTLDKSGWLERVEETRRTWEEIVAEAGDADLARPGVTEDWSFKDVAAHLNGWRVRTVDRLEAAARGETPSPLPWPAELDEESEAGTDAINRWFYEQSRDRSAAEILAEAREQYRRMRAAVEAVSDDDLLTPGRYSWLGGYPLCAVVQGSYDHLREEHDPALRAWLVTRAG